MDENENSNINFLSVTKRFGTSIDSNNFPTRMNSILHCQTELQIRKTMEMKIFYRFLINYKMKYIFPKLIKIKYNWNMNNFAIENEFDLSLSNGNTNSKRWKLFIDFLSIRRWSIDSNIFPILINQTQLEYE